VGWQLCNTISSVSNIARYRDAVRQSAPLQDPPLRRKKKGCNGYNVPFKLIISRILYECRGVVYAEEKMRLWKHRDSDLLLDGRLVVGGRRCKIEESFNRSPTRLSLGLAAWGCPPLETVGKLDC
jgi:hypothetical protein